MAYYYVVDSKQDEKGNIEADVPSGVSWVGQPFTDGSGQTTYLVKTTAQLDASQVRSVVSPLPDALTAECNARGLDYDKVVNVWAIGGEA